MGSLELELFLGLGASQNIPQNPKQHQTASLGLPAEQVHALSAGPDPRLENKKCYCLSSLLAAESRDTCYDQAPLEDRRGLLFPTVMISLIMV